MKRRTLLITGAAGGLGSALSLLAAEHGFGLVLLDRDRKGLERLDDRIGDQGFAQPALQLADLAAITPDDALELVEAIASEFGTLDAVVHCAARFESLTPLEHLQPEEWLLSLQVNLNAAWLISSLCLPLLRESSRGRIYFLLEDLERVGGALWGPYGVSKHALHAMVGQLAAECQSSGVQVLGIDPGPMRTALRARAFLAENPAAVPSPDSAAQKIMQLLTEKQQPSGVFVNLAGPGWCD